MGRIIHNPGTGWLIAALCVSFVAFVLWAFVLESVCFDQSPKTVLLGQRNSTLKSRMEIQQRRADICAEALEVLHSRDNDVYRSIFGMNSVPYEGISRSSALEAVEQLKRECELQSLSYRQIDSVLKNAGTMANSIPTICPIIPEEGTFKLSSSYGFREHPITGQTMFHSGMDLSLSSGSPIFATGDGMVESVHIELHGYGRQLVINHGFGYKTRYAHLREVFVTEGMKIHRGDQIATSGNTGLSTGAHLHYEVIYKGNPVNPKNYFDFFIPLDQYKKLIRLSADPKTEFYIHPMHRK